MSKIWAMTLMLLVSACANETQTLSDPVCRGTKKDRTDHAAALVEDGGPKSVVTGDRLITKLDAACNP